LSHFSHSSHLDAAPAGTCNAGQRKQIGYRGWAKAVATSRPSALASTAEIDRLVYDLYGLTDEEIAMVEGAGEK
jgi:hypothetical protein